ncbi:MAG: hypothetical protein EA360_07230 [Balneolaceae bacterium]|nr:MAG: hypothetical protein EA360_07230 [Balneolaceae bacterium]
MAERSKPHLFKCRFGFKFVSVRSPHKPQVYNPINGSDEANSEGLIRKQGRKPMSRLSMV